MVGTVRGLDFGTSTSLLAESTGLESEIVEIGRQNAWIPSIVGLDRDAWHVGEGASNLPENQILRSVKRAITENRDLVEIYSGDMRVVTTVDDVIRSILRSIVTRSREEFAALDEEGVVVRLGCPAMWTGEQRRRLIRLANEAGLTLTDATLIDEPIAAGVAWITERLRRGVATNGKVLVFDMGGGTLDVAVLIVQARPGTEAIISVQAAQGRNEAGDTLDRELLMLVKEKLLHAGFDADANSHSKEIEGWLLRAAREAKIELGDIDDVPVIARHPTIDVPIVRLSRTELEKAFNPQVDRAMHDVWSVTRAALMSQVASKTAIKSLRPDEARNLEEDELAAGVDYVLLAGGMARVPVLAHRLGTAFGNDKIAIESDPTTTIARGLGENRAYESLNLHRPGFDFYIEWTDASTKEAKNAVVYSAFSPLYDRFQVFQANSVKYSWKDPDKLLPRRGEGLLRVRSMTDQPIGLVIDGEVRDGIPVRFGDGDSLVTLEPNGRVYLRDSFGMTCELMIERWPVIKGRGYESIHVSTHNLAPSLTQWGYDLSGD